MPSWRKLQKIWDLTLNTLLLAIQIVLVSFFSGKLIVSNSTPRHRSERLGEPIRVLAVPLVEPESLLVQIPEKVVRLYGHIRPLYPALQ